MEAITPVSSPSASPSPSSTPSNERIFAYSQLQNGQLDLYEMNVTTGAIRQLSSSNISEAGPSYSPDGSQIAYYAYGSEDDPAELWIMNADGSEPRQLTNDPFDQRVVAWSPDGRYLAYHAETTRNGYEIFLYDLSNDTSRAVSQHPANDLAPAWSPDGSQLAFHSDEWNDNFDLYIIASDGSNRRRLTNGDSRYAFAAWSSQGQIVFHAILGSNTYRLQVIQPDGTGIQTLLEGQNQRHADWSSDGQALLYMAGDLNAPLIMLTTVGSAEGQVVAENGYFPDWQP
jgi:TolB protein